MYKNAGWLMKGSGVCYLFLCAIDKIIADWWFSSIMLGIFLLGMLISGDLKRKKK